MTPLLADASGLEMAGIIGALVFGGVAAIVSVIALIKKQEVKVEQPVDVQLVESLVQKSDYQHDQKKVREEFDNIWSTVRRENTSIRREITEAVQHCEERVMDKLETNRSELAAKIDEMPSKIIADLRNAKGLLE